MVLTSQVDLEKLSVIEQVRRKRKETVIFPEKIWDRKIKKNLV